MMKAWEKNIRKVVPYVPGEQPNKERMIKLNTNENPYPPAPGVAEALKNLDPDRLRLYPDPACTRLVDAIAKQNAQALRRTARRNGRCLREALREAERHQRAEEVG